MTVFSDHIFYLDLRKVDNKKNMNFFIWIFSENPLQISRMNMLHI